jgi:transcriptional regulator with XRE-family HTH domain
VEKCSALCSDLAHRHGHVRGQQKRDLATVLVVAGSLDDVRGAGDDLTIGQRIAFYRVRRSLTQRQLADLLGRSEEWVSSIERGRRELRRVDRIAEVAAALRVTLSDLLGQPVLAEDDAGGDDIPAIRDALMSPRRLSRLLYGVDERQKSAPVEAVGRTSNRSGTSTRRVDWPERLRSCPSSSAVPKGWWTRRTPSRQVGPFPLGCTILPRLCCARSVKSTSRGLLPSGRCRRPSVRGIRWPWPQRPAPVRTLCSPMVVSTMR